MSSVEPASRSSALPRPDAGAARRWAIVGGGLLGMTLAYRLAQHGREVTLLEASPELGGLASAWTLGDVVWDRHYHVTLLSDTHLRALLRELGLEHDMVWAETRTGFYTAGRLFSMSNTIEFLRFPPLNLLDKVRLAATIFYASKVRNWKRLETVPVAVWLRRWSGRRTFERIWLPLLRSKLGEDYTRTSAAFIWATIARMYAARRTGLKKEMFGYVPGGYARILERFSEALRERRVTIRVGCPVIAVRSEPDGAIRVETGDGTSLTFDQVVLTVPAPVAADLCPDLSDTEKDTLRAIEYQGIVCASMLARQPLSSFYVTNITDSSLPFTAVIEMSALVDRRHFGGHSLIYLPKYASMEDPVFAMSDAEIEQRFVEAVCRMYPHFRVTDVVRFQVSRVRYVYALPTLHYSERLPALTTSLPSFHIVNSAHIVNGTLNVNETVGLAERAVTHLLRLEASR